MRIIPVFRTALVPIKLLFGFDAFISYSRRDGTDYAESLTVELGKSISPRADLQETAPGGTLPFSLRVSVALSKVLVIVATSEAMASIHVAEEIQLFLRWSNGAIIPIEFSLPTESAVWWAHVAGITRIHEEAAVEASRIPSLKVVRRIVNSVGFWRLRRLQSLAALAFTGTFLLLSLFSYRADRSRRAADIDLNAATLEAEHQRNLAKRAGAESERQTAEARRQHLEAEQQQRIATSRRLAAESESRFGDSEELIERSAQLALHAVRLNWSIDTDAALRSSFGALSMPVWKMPDVVGGHQGFAAVRAGAFSSDLDYMAVAGDDNVLHVISLANRREVLRKAYKREIFSLTFSPNRSYLAVRSCAEVGINGCQGDGYQVIDLRTNQALPWVNQQRNGLDFETDSSRIIAADQDRVISNHLPDMGAEASVDLHDVNLLRLGPDGNVLVATDHSTGIATVWPDGLKPTQDDEHRPRILSRTFPLGGSPESLAISPDSQRIAVAVQRGTSIGSLVRIFDLDGEVISSSVVDNGVYHLTFDPTGTYVAGAAQFAPGHPQSTVHVWEVDSGRDVVRLSLNERVVALAISPSKACIMLLGETGRVICWHAGTSSTTEIITAASITSLRFSRDENHIEIRSDNGSETGGLHLPNTFELRSLADGRLIERTIDGSTFGWFSRDEDRIVIEEMNRKNPALQVRRTITGEVVREFREPFPHIDGNVRLFAYEREGIVYIDEIDGRRVARIRVGSAKGKEASPTLSGNGHLVGLSTADGYRVWSVQTGQLVGRLAWPRLTNLNSPVFTEDDRFALTSKYTQYQDAQDLCVWELAGKRHACFNAGELTTYALSPDSRYIAITLRNERVSIIDLASLTKICEVAHQRGVGALAFSDDSRYLATAGQDSTIRVWGAPDFRPVSRIPVNQPVYRLAWSPTGRYLAAAIPVRLRSSHSRRRSLLTGSAKAWRRI